MKKISISVAIGKNRVIGCENQLPWHLPNDLKHFKQLTLNKPVIMGRKTYESLGKPLPNRRNVIITRNKNYQASGCEIFSSLQEAIDKIDAPEIIIIGGESIYTQALPLATHLYLTFVDAEIQGDTFFPEINLI